MEKKDMEKKKEEDSKTWNISKDFTHELILQHLIKIEKYRTLAIFGYTSLESDIMIRDETLRSTSRVSAMRRLTDTIKSLIYFSSFDIKKPEHKTDFAKYLKRLIKIEKSIPELEVVKKKYGKHHYTYVNETLFSPMIVEISEMITSILNILNLAGFIFKREEIKDFSRSVIDM